METEQEATSKPDTFIEARALLDDAWDRAKKVYKEAKEQADTVHKQAKKAAVDNEGKQRADEAHKEALEDAKKLRDSIVNVGMAAFTEFWRQHDSDQQDALAKSKERSELAHKTLTDAREQADTDHREAMGKAGDSQARREADETRKGARKQAKTDYDKAKKDYEAAKKR